MGQNDNTSVISQHDFIRLKNRAFIANHRAHKTTGETRESFYRDKAAAINYLLEIGMAFVDSADWSVPDATFSVRFVGGGALHTKLSSLNSQAIRSIRKNRNGRLPEDFGVAESQRARN